MNNNENQSPSRIRELLNMLQSKAARRYIRITYGVIWNLTLLLLIIGVLAFSFAGGVGAGYFAAMVKDEPVRTKEDLSRDIYNYEETSEIYFANNVYLGKLKSDLEREEVTLEQVSKNLANAVIATEDEYFYQHDGVVPKAIMRAIFQELTNSSVQSGGSTLTQQLIKNQVLTNEVSFERKAKEILLALRVEKFFEKEEILETYLNVSTFGRNSSGRNIAGVESAAEGIFGKPAKDLNLPQSAFIAGLPQSPFGYTPYTQKGELKKNLEPGLSRMKTVLKRMHDGGYITDKDYSDALKYDIVGDFIEKKPSPQEKYPWVTYEIEKRSIEILMKILAKQDGYEESDLTKDKDLREQYMTLADRNLHQNGYKIYSTIDKKIYDKMQKVKDNYAYYGPDKPQEVKDPETKKTSVISEPVETGAILIENKTGKIISFVGGRDHKREQTNHATASLRPNGSTMKPILVYAPGMELGKLSPGTITADVPMTFPGGWKPSNYGESYSGLTTARNALAKSYNMPAIKFYLDILNQNPVKYLEKMGFTSIKKDHYTNMSMAIGTMETTVEENVNSYTTFANGGKFIDAYMIDRIETKDGKVIYQHKPKPVKVFSPQTAYLTIDMMRDVINKGTAVYVNSQLAFSSDWAGKTGTGNEYKDAWFVATNPNVTLGTWMGYDNPKSLKGTYKGLEYNQRNLRLWAGLANAAYKVNPKLMDPKKRFEMPGGIVRRSFCGVSGLLPSDACSRAGMVETDLFNAKYVPTKVDDSFINGKYVQVGNKRYAALPETPSEFASVGFMLNPVYFERIGGKYVTDPGLLIPKDMRWGNIMVPNAVLRDNGKVPAAPSATASGRGIAWNTHPENDVIGYRIYSNGRRIGSVRAGSSLSFSGAGSLYVSAVDVAGKESPPSNVINAGFSKKPEEKEDTPDSEDSTPPETKNPENTKPEKPKNEKPKNEKPNDPNDSEAEGDKPNVPADPEKPEEPGEPKDNSED
ncbi:transglycosylase domain-containing protein [Peribacillus sp. SCS-155]|uniref:transglycosylase domain-containing protein n=1 Tax=Peribacillus sedimenti TaxID=3115297 RepID=UPI003906B8AF